MVYEKGKFIFPSKEYLDELIKAGILKEYDLSSQDREKHDEEVRKKREGIKDEKNKT